MATVDMPGLRPKRPLRELLQEVTQAGTTAPPTSTPPPAPAPNTAVPRDRERTQPPPTTPAAPTGGSVSTGTGPIGSRWWNRGKPPHEWTEFPPSDPGTPPPPPTDTGGTSTSTSFSRTPENMPAGIDPVKWSSGHMSPKYAWAEITAKHNLGTAEGQAAGLAEAKARWPQWFGNATLGHDRLDIGGELHEDFNGLNAFDAIEDYEGANRFAWQPLAGPRYDEYLRSLAPAAEGSGAPAGPGGYPAGTTLVGPNGATFPLTFDGNGKPIIPQGYQLQAPSNFTGGNPGLGGISGQPGGQEPFDWDVFNEAQYDDPNTQMLEDFTRKRIEDLLTTPADPAMDDLLRVLTQRFGQLAEPGSGANPAAADLDAQAQARIQELLGDPFSDPEEDQMRAEIYDDLERRRAETKDRVLQEMAALGHDRTSGTIAARLQEVDAAFDQERAKAERDLGLFMIEERQRRRGEALDVGQTRVDNQGRELERGENRLREALAIAGQVAGVSGQQRGDREARADQALTLVSLLSELDDRAFQRAMQALGMSEGSNPSAIFQNLLALSTSKTNASQQNQAQTQNMLLGLGQMFGYMYANQAGGAS